MSDSPWKRLLRSPHRLCRIVGSFGLLVLALLLAGSPGAALAASTPGCGKEEMPESYSIMDILDDKVPMDVRMANVAILKRHGELPACKESRYLLGNLYQYGPDLPGNPLPKDPARARPLIEGYALDGYSYAFAQLAELALAEGDAVEAMQWTQVYLYLVRHYQGPLVQFERSGYNANLLARVEKAWRKSKSKGSATPASLLNAYFNRTPALGELAMKGFEQTHQNDVATKSEAGLGETGLRVKRRNSGGGVNFRIEPGFAVYLLEVQPSGQVSRIAAQSFGPTPDHAKKLRALVEGWEYYPHRGEKAELVRVPVMYGELYGPEVR